MSGRECGSMWRELVQEITRRLLQRWKLKRLIPAHNVPPNKSLSRGFKAHCVQMGNDRVSLVVHNESPQCTPYGALTLTLKSSFREAQIDKKPQKWHVEHLAFLIGGGS